MTSIEVEDVAPLLSTFRFLRQTAGTNNPFTYLVRNLRGSDSACCPALVTLFISMSQNHVMDDCKVDLIRPVVTKPLIREHIGEQVLCPVDYFHDMAQQLVAFGINSREDTS